MRLLIDIGHPAHVHLFRNAIHRWQERGHNVVITARDKDLTTTLLDRYQFPYILVSRARTGTRGLAIEYLQHSVGVLKAALQHCSQLLLGTSVSIGPVARLTGARAIVFNEDDANVVRAFSFLAYKLAHLIVTPTCLNENYGSRHVKYPGYQKLAYLHPNVFTPNRGILTKLNIEDNEPYFIVRLVSLQAAHDRGEKGIEYKRQLRLINFLSRNGRVFVTSEGPLTEELEPYRIRIAPELIHDAIAFAKMVVSDSQTMTAEAAILGVPAIRCNTFVGRISYLEELEHRYQLTFGFQPKDEEFLFKFMSDLLAEPNLTVIWQQRHQKMLSEKIDVTAWMVDMVERYAEELKR